MTTPRTLFDRIWASHAVVERDDGYTLLYIDRHLMHDGSAGCFGLLHERGLPLRRPDRSFGTPDHFVASGGAGPLEPLRRRALEQMTDNAARHGFTMFDLGDARQGIAHVVGPEQGVTQPGLTMVCGDSHTSTHGALGALAFGIGQSEVAHVMATQCLWQRRPKSMRIRIEGRAPAGVVAKDMALALIARIGAGGATGHVIEYAGEAVRALTIEGRLTLCNMSIEAGARAGMVAPDEITIDYLRGRPYAPQGADLEKAEAHWRALVTDEGAVFDREVTLDAAALAPMVTWGVSPEDALPVDGRIPDPAAAADQAAGDGMRRTLDYMGLTPGEAIESIEVDRVFIGSCTNSRIEDLRAAALVAKGRKTVRPAWVVPGSGLVKRQAEAEGLDAVFREAGFEWREPGCSMCVGMNGDTGRPGERIASTTNRNFQGRQGQGVRTHLVSPAMAAAAAVEGRFTDVRRLLA
ncbi:3-isopropylmalate dehydratase, large subunit [Albimonas donghaensis]|uniref:3-isopropylmalate dehydratase large subunit n=1 Tax=Albimonas donghaensis TaxID=356660 RepID=A0A1H3DQG1_9RHOB|nr:3-isopropylmalate dehydratase large subunit [Albimonas donghaensis]SDX68762.1 3-isopropylmalate dehydratase, large subunit [Albimonas donghaensis]